MAIWTVWEHDRFDEDRRVEKAVFVRDGFSFLAFVLPPLWLLANGMIVVLIAFLALAGGLAFAVDSTGGPQLATLVSVVLAFWFGFEARALRRWSLARRGWRMTAVVEASDFREAERRYVDARLEETGRAASQPPAGSVPPTGPAPQAAPWGAPSSSGVLGVFPEGQR